ncbi:MAG: ABC transporter ATP-binding protein [Lachnospiraceae bacterium]
MGKLLKYLKKYRKEAIIGPLFKLLEAGLELLVPLVVAQMIDVGIKAKDSAYIWNRGGVLVLFAILGCTCSLTAQYFAAKAAVGFGTGLRHDLFAHVESLSYREIDAVGSSTLVVRMTSDINQVQSGVNLFLRLFLRSPFIIIGAMVMAFTIHIKMALIFLVAVPILGGVIYLVMTMTIPLYQKVQKSLDALQLTTKENLKGIRVIRAFGTQKTEQQEFAEESSQLMKYQLFVGKISALLNPVTYIIVNMAMIGIVWFGGQTVQRGELTQGQVIALVNYMMQILLALLALANLIISFTKALASAGRINEIFALSGSLKEGTQSQKQQTQERVCMQHVEFTYQGDQEATLSDITFTANQGETIGIIGGTGSGKTTLVNLIPRFYDATKGMVSVDGQQVTQYRLQELRQKIGVVPQEAELFHGTISENIRMGKKGASQEEMIEAITIAQANDIVSEMPEGLDTVISEGGKNLSGGQRQRLTIARALVKKPEILILDDSTSALDFITDARLRKSLEEHTNSMTIFIVSQRASSLMHADQIIVLEDGHIAGKGTHGELLASCSVYQEICHSQWSKEEVAHYG